MTASQILSISINITCVAESANTFEDEDHILACKVINTELHEVAFSDVYGNVNEQCKAGQVYKKVLRRTKTYMDIAEKTVNPSS